MGNNSYRQAFKATSIFGGVQAIKLGIGLVRSKFVAVLIGPSGSGVASLLNNPLGLIGTLTGFGIAYSAIRDLSEAHAEGNPERFARTLITFRRWVWATGLLGMIVTLLLAPFLSISSFGDKSYTWAFLVLSITFVINSISSGQGSVLYATRRIKESSQSALIGNIIGVLTSIPLYYKFGLKGIVPALLIGSITNLILTWLYTRKIKIVKVKISYKESFKEGLSFAKVGFAMMLSGMLGNAIGYFTSAFISHLGGVEQVGLYNACWGITGQFVSMVFSAMGADYYPRLSGVNKDNDKVIKAVNEQTEIGLLLIGPIMLFYILILPILIPLMLSSKYLPILSFAQWVIIGMLLKSVGWSLGFIALAKGDSKLFFRLEIYATIINSLTILAGYYFWGLEGVGAAFVVTYSIYVSYMYLFYKKYLGFFFSKNTIKIFCFFQSLCFLAFLSVKFLPPHIGYGITTVLFGLSFYYSFKILKFRLGIDPVAIIKKKFFKKKAAPELAE